mmetsp:Transcript_6672/g.19030  ORF Transcript_6672/g.19030 Transcript_6672/m.19030 type:complete len:113 (-) Transcript_6672:1155-1493(-)
MPTSCVYWPSLFMRSSSCVPFSTITPCSMTQIWSAFRTVASLCATTIVVRRFAINNLSNASWTTCSLAASKALVASSKSSTGGFRTSALAIAILCFWPPLSCALRELPRSVL